MTPSRLSILTLSGLLFLLLACGMLRKKPQPDAAPSASVVAAPLVAPPVVPEPPAPVEIKVADEAIPTPEDFEDEAFDKITDKTYKPELAALKKELAPPAALAAP